MPATAYNDTFDPHTGMTNSPEIPKGLLFDHRETLRARREIVLIEVILVFECT